METAPNCSAAEPRSRALSTSSRPGSSDAASEENSGELACLAPAAQTGNRADGQAGRRAGGQAGRQAGVTVQTSINHD